MNNLENNRKSIIFIVSTQLIIGVFLILLTYALTRDFNDTNSLLIGVLMSIMSTLCYVLITFRVGFVHLPKIAYKNHQIAVIIKFMLNIVVFILVLNYYKNCNFLLMLIGYVLTMSSYWLSLIKKQ